MEGGIAMTSNFFRKFNPSVLEAKGGIPYYVIANKLSVHENTVRNWMKREMAPEKKVKVLKAIEEIKQELVQAQ